MKPRALDLFTPDVGGENGRTNDETPPPLRVAAFDGFWTVGQRCGREAMALQYAS
jgi:hypothetical protein